MPSPRRAHDDRLLDALSEIAPVLFEGRVWRVVRDGRSPLDGSRGSGRWNPAPLSVLYCSRERDGAMAEIFFHLSRGQPVFPSRIRHALCELKVKTEKTLKLLNIDQLTELGVDMGRYKEILYERTREIGDAAAFLGFDGLITPSARLACANLVLFADNIDFNTIEILGTNPIDWNDWRRREKGHVQPSPSS